MVRVSVDLGVMLNRFKFWRHINWNTVTYRLVAFSASEVTTLWRYTNLFIIIIIVVVERLCRAPTFRPTLQW